MSKQFRLSKEEIKRVVRLYKSKKYNCVELSHEFGITSAAILGLLKRRNIKIRTVGRFEKGHIPWSVKFAGKGIVKAWNKGLTKETDYRMMACSVRMIMNNPTKRKLVRDKISKSNTGKIMPLNTRDKISNAHKGKMPKNIKHLISIDRNGKNNPMYRRPKEYHWNWKGGITSVVQSIRHCFAYTEWRKKIFKRDNYTCVLCGKDKCYLEADHFPKKFSDIFQENKINSVKDALKCKEFWNCNNGRTLCRICHRKTLNYGRKEEYAKTI